MQFIRPRRVLELIGLSRTTLWRMVRAGTFPRPVRITERSRGYVLEAVEAWMRARADGPSSREETIQLVASSRIALRSKLGHAGRRA
jgi:prophage regulatory protein